MLSPSGPPGPEGPQNPCVDGGSEASTSLHKDFGITRRIIRRVSAHWAFGPMAEKPKSITRRSNLSVKPIE
mgnify:CR=1 FL=1